EDAGVYKHLRGIDFIGFIAEVYAEDKSLVGDMVDYAVKISGLGPRLYDPMNTYSKGMKRRLLLATTLMTRPKLAILDEPTSGLDVYHSVVMRNTIKDYVRESKAAILLSSHNMLEVEYLCDRVAFINKGRIIASGRPGELKRAYEAENLEEAFIKAVEAEEAGLE
ncbi:MAG: ABC transporter ATP-binding protein, partial [Desulfurococcales archaeon]|nr:ABC transporter ATP-binding protein [Desulfurococcales archaeon]